MKAFFLLLLVFNCLNVTIQAQTPTNSAHLTQDIYVWQRVWKDEVGKAVERIANQSCGRIREVVPLVAEVSFSHRQPFVICPEIDYSTLKNAPSCGLALRIGSYHDPFEQDDAVGHYLQKLACKLVSDARKSSCRVSELQIDFDCAASKLKGYECWLMGIQKALQSNTDGVQVSITVLPSWMSFPEFGPLVRQTGSFVLQVHSVELPMKGEEPVLCDPERARHWVEQAGSYGVPFRVALPTYTSVVAISPSGKVVGISNEGPLPTWPVDSKVVMVRPKDHELAQLVSEWQHRRPASMTGLIWYRLPVSTDKLNWHWPTLAAVMDGRTPRSSLRVEVTQKNPYDIRVVNDGESAELLPNKITAKWEAAALVADDSLNGFALENGVQSVTFTENETRTYLSPGECRVIGWLRLSSPTKIYATEN